MSRLASNRPEKKKGSVLTLASCFVTRADYKQRDAVANPPENSGQRGAANLTLAPNDGRDGNDVIGVGNVTRTEKETEGEDREKSHGKLTSRALICRVWFVWTEPDRFDFAFFSLRFWRAGLRGSFSPDSA